MYVTALLRIFFIVLDFLPRDAMQARRAALAVMRCLSVCVCVSVTFIDSVKTNKHKKFFTIG